MRQTYMYKKESVDHAYYRVDLMQTRRAWITYMYTSTTTSNDPRFNQCIYRYSHASKRFVEVYT